MRLPHKDIAHGRRGNAGFTLIEVLEGIVAAFLAVWLATRLGHQFHGAWRAVVFCTVAFLGTLVFSFCLILGLGYVFEAIERQVGRKTPHQSDEPVEDGEGAGSR